MESREAEHINHSRRPPSQKEFGPSFFIPFTGLSTILLTPTKWYKNAPDRVHWVARSAQPPGHFRTRYERKATVPPRATSGYIIATHRLKVKESNQ